MRTRHTLHAVYKIMNVPVLENTRLLAISISAARVANVKRKKSIKLSKDYLKENICLYIQESLELCGSLWKPMIGNASGGAGGETGVRAFGSGVVSLFVDLFCSGQSFVFPFFGSRGRWVVGGSSAI
jgi:hypothetical protein